MYIHYYWDSRCLNVGCYEVPAISLQPAQIFIQKVYNEFQLLKQVEQRENR